MYRNQQVIGLVILLAGVIILLSELGISKFIDGITLGLVLLLLGISLYVFAKYAWLPAIMMVPAGMLMMYGLLTVGSYSIHERLFGILWPLILLGIGFGLYKYYQYDSYHPLMAWQAALCFGGLGILMLCFMLLFTIGIYVIALLFISIGISLICRNIRNQLR